jgi:predicted dithiol-disulfide oxidoreductase (DUF899 family)
MTIPEIVSAEDWTAARDALLVEEKAHTRAGDALAAKRRRMPAMRVRNDYRFEAPGGADVTLLDLFEGRSQLIVYRFFMDPGMDAYPERGCPGCSMEMDQLAHLAHLNARGVTYAVASRGSQEHLQAFRATMGWGFPWYTILDDFDTDFGVGEWHGTNVFLREGDDVYRTYYVHDRGDSQLGSTWSLLDITPYGRQEQWEDSPAGWPQTEPYQWWRYHDRYGAG